MTPLPAVVPCLTCGRPLTDEVSRRVQRGEVCRRRAGIVVVVLGASSGRVASRPHRVCEVAPEQMALELGEAS